MHQKNKLTSHRSWRQTGSTKQFLHCHRFGFVFSLSAAEYRQFENSKFTTMAKHTLPQMLKEARPMTKYQPQRIQSVYKWISVGLMLLSMRRPAASDSTKCVQSK